nr:hypothetical protein [Pelomonas sp. P8]
MWVVLPKVRLSLDAGELVRGQLPHEQPHDHVSQALNALAVHRIGHGASIGLERQADSTLNQMATQRMLVETHLTQDAVLLGLQGAKHPVARYRQAGVPLALSASDDSVLRIDLTHEYQRAVETHAMGYLDLKELSRNALAYSFLQGDSLLLDTRSGARVPACGTDRPGSPPSRACSNFLAGSEKALIASS